MESADLLKFAGQYRLSQAIYAAAALEVADHLEDGPLHAAELAARVGADGDYLRRLMRALASEGVFTEGEDGRFALNPAARLLATGGGTREMILGWTVLPPSYAAFARLTDGVRDGKSPFQLAHGIDFHEYLAANSWAARAYDSANAETTDAFDRGVAAYDFTGIETIVDVGGGTGGLLCAVLRAYPGARGVLFDLPAVVAGFHPEELPPDLASRVATTAGDFFTDPVPPGDAYLLSTVVRLFDDARATRLLTNLRGHLPPGGRVLMLDFVHPPGRLVAPYGVADLSAMVVYGGQDRSESEFAALLAGSGLRLKRVVETGEVHKWVEAVSDQDPA